MVGGVTWKWDIVMPYRFRHTLTLVTLKILRRGFFNRLGERLGLMNKVTFDVRKPTQSAEQHDTPRLTVSQT